MADTYSWTGSSSISFGVASNWIDESTGMVSTTVPGAQDTAELFGSGLITGTGTVAVLDVAPTSNGYTLGAATLGAAQASVSGFVILDYGSRLAAGALRIGSTTTASDVQLVSSTLTSQAGSLDLTVSGSDSVQEVILYVGSNQVAGPQSLVDIGQGAATFGDGNDQYGVLLLFGGTLAGGTGSSLVFGKDGGFGQGTISSGGTVSMTGAMSVGDGGNGEVSVLGGVLSLGSQGAIALSIGTTDSQDGPVQGAFLSSTGGTILLHGSAQIGVNTSGSMQASGGTLSTQDGITLGAALSGEGTLVLGVGTAWSDTGDVIVGAAGEGILTLNGATSGGTDTIAGELALGLSGGQGNVTITSQALRVTGPTRLGGASANSLTVAGGGLLDSTGQTITLAASQGDTLDVKGTASALRAAALLIGNGSTVSFDTATTGTIGSAAGAPAVAVSGGLLVSGAVRVTGGVTVTGANAGAHGLEINGGTLAIGGAAGLAVSANGQVNLSGSTSVLSAGGGIVLGDGGSLNGGGSVTVSGGAALTVSGSASLNLIQGALQTTGAFEIGGDFQASAEQVTSTSATITGQGAFAHFAGSTWTLGGNLDVGTQAGGGELFLVQGSRASIGGTLAVGAGTGAGVVQSGAILCGPGLAVATGQTGLAAIAISVTGTGSVLQGTLLQVGYGSGAGNLSIAGGEVMVTGDARLRGNVVLSQGGVLSAGGALGVAAGTTLIGQGTVSASSIVDAGRIGVFGGTMTCLGPVTGPGLLSVREGDVVLGSTAAASVGLVFGNDGTFTAASVGDLAGTIAGWQPNDALDFTGVHIATDSYADGTLSLFGSSGQLLGRESFSGTYSSTNFTLSSDHGTGTLLSYHT